jgi:L-alanine-DL-glutamate epimerase-like enolase superfamily enzyme
VDTDQGVTGYGVGGGGPAGVHIVEAVLRELLLGQDATAVEGLWDLMYRRTMAFGRKGVTLMAISGVDLALWDLRGIRSGMPVAEVLGGAVGRPISAYRTVFSGEEVQTAVEEGYSSIKLHVGSAGVHIPASRIVDEVREAREAVGGDVELMADAFMNWDIPYTLEVARQIEPLDIAWLEEPLPADDLAGYARLAEECPIPLAGGEHEYTAAAFRELMERGLHRIYQPDICWCGGLTEVVKIYALAKEHGLRVCPHRGAEAWGLHAVAGLDPQPLAESGRTWMDWVDGAPEIVDGTVRLEDRPGFGVTFDPNLW